VLEHRAEVLAAARHHARVHLELLPAAPHLSAFSWERRKIYEIIGRNRSKNWTEAMGRAVCLKVGEAPALVQVGEVARERHGVRLVDPGGVRWRGRGCGLLTRTLAGSHFKEPELAASRGKTLKNSNVFKFMKLN
jgi:hypothetical protein